MDGIGGAMFSEMVYDDVAQLLTGSLADYLVATAPGIPRIRLISMETRATTIRWACAELARAVPFPRPPLS